MPASIGRSTIAVTGESGQGINLAGELIAQSLQLAGYHIFAYREYPSLIQGGISSMQVEVSDIEVSDISTQFDLLIAISRSGLHNYLPQMKQGSQVLHNIPKLIFTPEEHALIQTRDIMLEYVDARQLAQEVGESNILENVVMLGAAWQLTGLDLTYVEKVLQRELAHKPQLLVADQAALEVGFRYPLTGVRQVALPQKKNLNLYQSILAKGNDFLAAGAIAAGARAFYGYPMTPTSSIISYLANKANDTGMIVKQAEDEITAAQMALGSMFGGTRAFTATSGGGFDLMTESVSLAGMTETPFVVVLGQRPGPATGLPTWTASGDLDVALFAGHGEFPRVVLAASDAASAYTLIQQSFNLAEQFQLPVILLTDKYIAESHYQLAQLPQNLPIVRGLVPEYQLPQLQAYDRYADTPSGVSLRWLPGQKAPTFNANSDEHDQAGNVTEDANMATLMMEKRMRKLNLVLEKCPEPMYFGRPDAEVVLVGWGSVKSPAREFVRQNPGFGYLHFEYIWPLATKTILELHKSKPLVLVENNYTAQLGSLITRQTGIGFQHQILRSDGRPVTLDYIVKHLQ